MSSFPFEWPGLPGGPIIFDFPVSAMIPPAWRTNVRPGIRAQTPRLAIQHENGNPNALARQDSVYLFSGAGGRQASWHATVDHLEGFANLPANEVGWQASDGSGPGNMRGFAIELSQWPMVHGTPVQWRRARRNAAQIGGRVGARLGILPPSGRHRDYAPDRKNCPQYLNGNPVWWNEYIQDWLFFYNDEKSRMGGQSVMQFELAVGCDAVTTDSLNVRTHPSTTGALVATLPVNQSVEVTQGPQADDAYRWWHVTWLHQGTMRSGWCAGDWLRATSTAADIPTKSPVVEPTGDGPHIGERVVVTAGLYLRQGQGTSSRVLTLLQPGTTANVIDGPRYADGYRWLDIKGEFGTGWVADAWLNVVGKEIVEPEPLYAPLMPISELLKTNLNYDEIADGVVTANETEFVYTANLLEFKRLTPALQYAHDSAPEVRAPYQEGARAIEAWRCRNHQGIWYSLLTGPEDEWVRVRSDHAVVVGGSPLLGDDLE